MCGLVEAFQSLSSPHSFGVFAAERLQHLDDDNAARYERQALWVGCFLGWPIWAAWARHPRSGHRHRPSSGTRLPVRESGTHRRIGRSESSSARLRLRAQWLTAYSASAWPPRPITRSRYRDVPCHRSAVWGCLISRWLYRPDRQSSTARVRCFDATQLGSAHLTATARGRSRGGRHDPDAVVGVS